MICSCWTNFKSRMVVNQTFSSSLKQAQTSSEMSGRWFHTSLCKKCSFAYYSYHVRNHPHLVTKKGSWHWLKKVGWELSNFIPFSSKLGRFCHGKKIFYTTTRSFLTLCIFYVILLRLGLVLFNLERFRANWKWKLNQMTPR